MVLSLAFLNLGLPETVVILVVGLLVFGSRLPEVGRSVGRGLMEFKRGLAGLKDEVGSLDREADRALDDEIERRRQAASAHDLEDDPRGPEDAGYGDPQPDASAGEPAGSGRTDGRPTTSSHDHEDEDPDLPPDARAAHSSGVLYGDEDEELDEVARRLLGRGEGDAPSAPPEALPFGAKLPEEPRPASSEEASASPPGAGGSPSTEDHSDPGTTSKTMRPPKSS